MKDRKKRTRCHCTFTIPTLSSIKHTGRNYFQ